MKELKLRKSSEITQELGIKDSDFDEEKEISPDFAVMIDRELEPTAMQYCRKVIEQFWDLRMNEITLRLENKGVQVNDSTLLSMWVKVAETTKKVKKENFYDFVFSDEIPKYNPFSEFTEANKGLKGNGNIHSVFFSLNIKRKRYAEFYYTCFRKWFIGLVAGIDRQSANLLMPILIGEVHSGKSFFFKHLLPNDLTKNWFTINMLNDGKDSCALMCSKLLILADDLEPANLKDSAKFRSFISQDHYTYRVPYRTTNETFLRLASLCGTSNYKEIITESRNNRRIIPIEIKDYDFDLYNSVDKVELFMEAYRAYKAGESYELTREESIKLSLLSKEFEETDIEAELIDKYFAPASRKDVGAVFLQANEIVRYIIEKESGENGEETKSSGLKLYPVPLAKKLTKSGFIRTYNGQGSKQKYGYYLIYKS